MGCVIGYVELDANIMGRVFPGIGFLIVRDPTGAPIATRKFEVPDVIGSNIFRDMNTTLTKDDTGSKEECRSSCDHMWSAVLVLYEEQCAMNVGRTMCKVRVAGKQSVIVPARSVRIIPGSVTAAAGGQIYYGVVEELESVALPRGLIVSLVYVAVVFCCKPGQRGYVSETKDSVGLHAGCSINRRDSPRF